MVAKKLDIFEMMAAIDARDSTWLDRRDEDLRKEFTPFVAMRWGSAVSDGPTSEFYLTMVNERVNLGLWSLGDHPELIFRLLASCGYGRKQRHQWVPMVAGKRGGTSNPARDLLASFHPSASDSEIDLLLSLHTRQTFTAFAEATGSTPETIKEALKAYDRIAAKERKRRQSAAPEDQADGEADA